jgi:hypothetical protein
VKDPFEFIENITYWLPRTSALLDRPCYVCNSKENVEMHHVKKLKHSNLKKADYLTARMIKINRKQLPLCKECHIKLHTGKKYGPGL